MKRPIILIGALIVIIVVAVVGWWLISPLFIDEAVDEAFPFEMPSAEEIAAMSDEEKEKMEEQIMEAAATMPDKTMEEPMPDSMPAEPTVLKQGQFQDADSFHKGSGSTTVYQVPEGKDVLRFEDFSATNGPDLHVILSSNPNPTSRSDIGDDYVDLGSLKGNVGNQNYEIPDDVDVSKYQSVVIYCMPFHVVFATATLN